MRVLLFTAVLALLVPTALHAGDGDYVIGDGDVLGISVWGEPSLSQTIAVRPDGKITIPALGDVVATGSTPSELSKQLGIDLKKFVKVPIVTVTVTGINNSKVYVFGGGPGTGVHILPGRTTLLKFLAGLGNLKEADLKKSYLLRDGKKVHSDFHDLFVKGDLTKDAEIEPGDLIFMPDNFDNKVYVMGAVVNPTFVVFRDNLSVLDAILEVGGFTEFAHRDKVFILRKESGKVRKIKADVEKVMKDGDLGENIELKKGDFVVVRESIF